MVKHPKSVIINNDGDNSSLHSIGRTKISGGRSDGKSNRQEQELSKSPRHELGENQQNDMIAGALILAGDDDDDDVDNTNTSNHHPYRMNSPPAGSRNDLNISNSNVILCTIGTSPDFDSGSEGNNNNDDLNTIPPSVNMDMDMTTTTIDETIELFNEMKRNIFLMKISITCIFLVFVISTSYLSHALYTMQQENEKLRTDLERLEGEKVELLVMKDMLLEGGFGVLLQEPGSSSDEARSTIFEINNCYLNLSTKVALGQCTKNLYDKFNDWYYNKHKDRQCLSKMWSDQVQ